MINIQSNDEEGSKTCVCNQKNVMETAMTRYKVISSDDANAIGVSFCSLLQSQFFFIFNIFLATNHRKNTRGNIYLLYHIKLQNHAK